MKHDRKHEYFDLTRNKQTDRPNLWTDQPSNGKPDLHHKFEIEKWETQQDYNTFEFSFNNIYTSSYCLLRGFL